MKISRRQILAATASLPLASGPTHGASRLASLPDKAAFAPTDVAYLDNGGQHPLPLAAKAAIEAYLAKRALDPSAQGFLLDEEGPIAKFARLINADPDEVTYVQSTTAGEQMVLQALDIPAAGGHIVSDTLHFFGSIPIYLELAKRGMDVTWLRPVDGRIRIDDMKAAVRKGTRLVALSLVSTINGFQHDLKAVCDIAHAHGALVYADIVHAAGCVPVDVKASGVDFAAASTYKWLMGDFGLGFLYVRKDLLPKLKRSHFGYYGVSGMRSHIYPLDPPGDAILDYDFLPNATGGFALGTRSHMVIAQLNQSLDYILGLGVSTIQAHAQELVGRMKRELPKRGYTLMTPLEATTPFVTCVFADARKMLAERMRIAKVRITTAPNRFRLTPSIQNDHIDLDRFLAALPKI